MMKHLTVVSLSLAFVLGSVHAHAAEASGSVSATTDASTPAAASTDKKKDVYFEVGVALGLVIGTSGFGLGPGVGLDLGPSIRLGPGALAIHLRTQYQQQGKEGKIDLPCTTPPSSPCLQGTTMDWKVREQALDFGLRFAYRFMPPERSWTPYLGAAPKMYLVKATTTSYGLDNTETDTRFGFAFFGGAQANLGPGHLFGELEYQWAPLRHTITGDGHLAGVAIAAGYRFAF